jgi:hypothetical protein
VGKKEEKTEETQAFPTQPSHKDALMVSSVPEAAASPSDIDHRIVKAVDAVSFRLKNKNNKKTEIKTDSYFKTQ